MFLFKEENNNDTKLLWSTIEPVDLVQQAYPLVVEQFFAATAAKKPKKPTCRKAIANDPADSAPSAPKIRKKAQPKTPILIDRFLQRIQNRRPKSASPIKPPIASPKIETSSQPMDLSMLFLDESDWTQTDDTAQLDLSGIIQGMVAKQPEVMEFRGRRLRYDHCDLGGQEDKENVVQSHNVISGESAAYNSYADVAKEKNMPADESLDEIDQLIMGSKERPLSGCSSTYSSTPILLRNTVENYCPSNRTSPIKVNQQLCPTPEVPPEMDLNYSDSSEGADAHVSNFFSLDLEPETDEFENSIDFHRMPDEFPEDEEQPRFIRVASTQNPVAELSPKVVVLQEDSFNLNGYVPVGNNMRKRLGSK